MKILGALILLFTLTGCLQPRPVDRFPANAEQTDTTSNVASAQTGGVYLSLGVKKRQSAKGGRRNEKGQRSESG